MTSFVRWATEATASLPSIVTMRRCAMKPPRAVGARKTPVYLPTAQTLRDSWDCSVFLQSPDPSVERHQAQGPVWAEQPSREARRVRKGEPQTSGSRLQA